MLNGTFCFPSDTLASSDDTGSSPCVVSERFVAGPENSLLKAVEDALRGEVVYNPVVLLGPSGVGKTHLLRLIYAVYKARHAQRPTLWIAGAEFARTYAAAVELDAITEFRKRHRRVGLFVMDDLQHLATKRSAQVDLLHTLDKMVPRDRQVVIASRFSFSEMDWLVPGLASRLSSGLTVPIAKPARATRRALLAELASDRGIELSDQIVEKLLQDDRFDCWPKLNNALLQFQASRAAAPEGEQARLELQVDGVAHPQLTHRQITSHVARYFRLKSSDLTGPTRKQNVVRARGIAVYLIRKLNGTSFERIGQHFGGRDHSTSLHAYRRIAGAVQSSDPWVAKAVREIAERLGVDAFT